MELKEIMSQKNFAVLGDTVNPEKYAYRIKHAMQEAGYTVWSVGKELKSLNDVPGDIDVIDLCIHPAKGLNLLKENRRSFKAVLIQPGAESEELLTWLESNHIPYLQSCLLVGLRTYPAAAVSR